MKKLLSLFLSVFAIAVSTQAKAEASGDNPVVIELFTSEGCSSCPPADDLTAEYADRDDVILLSYHVDYWNYIGWKDPYSSAENTERQKFYARHTQDGKVYTPQVVVQGEHAFVGSDRIKLARSVIFAGNETNQVKVSAKKVGDKIEISLPETADINAEIVVVGYLKHTESKVTRGENRGRSLDHRNSVTEFNNVLKWTGAAQTISVASPSGDGVAVLVQSRKGAQILGATSL